MANERHRPDDGASNTLPDQLVDDLVEFYGEREVAPGALAAVDAAVLAAARARLAEEPRRAPRKHTASLVWAGAAAAVLVVWIGTQISIRHDATPPVVVNPSDIDGNGVVNILDAFAVARSLERGTNSSPEWDINEDGEVSDADVRAIALAAVSLSSGAQP